MSATTLVHTYYDCLRNLQLAVLQMKQDLKATTQLSSLLLDGKLWGLSVDTVSGAAAAAAEGPTSPPLALAAKTSMPPSSAAQTTVSESLLHNAMGCNQAATLPSEQVSSQQPAAMYAAAEWGSCCSTIGRAARLSITLLGFSKGGVVLNQFLAELAAAAESASKSTRNCCHGVPANKPPVCYSVDSQAAGSSPQPIDAVGKRRPEASAASRHRREQTAPHLHAAGSSHSIEQSLYAVPPNGAVGSSGAKHHAVSTAPPAAANPQPAAAALLCAIKELHYLDVGLNCRSVAAHGPLQCQIPSWSMTLWTSK